MSYSINVHLHDLRFHDALLPRIALACKEFIFRGLRSMWTVGRKWTVHRLTVFLPTIRVQIYALVKRVEPRILVKILSWSFDH